MQYRADIDGLRMVAVVPVVLFHANLPGVTGGYVGVDVFFVISGFLITNIIQREIEQGRFSILSFYERRARRILPALITVILASFAVGWFLLLPGEFESLSKSALATVAFASNFWFWREANDYFGKAAEFSPLLHTWSLAVEEQFYIVFPALLLILASFSHTVRLTLLSGLLAISFLVAVYATLRWPAASFYLLPTRAWELGLGVLLGLGFAPRSVSAPMRDILGLSALAAILVPVVLYDDSTPFPGVAALPPCLGAAIIIWLGGTGGSIVNRALSFRPVVFVGLISYSLYLWHWPIMAFVRVRLGDVEIPLEWGLISIFVSTILAIVSWRYIEKPFRNRSVLGISRPAIFLISGTSIAAVSAVAVMVWLLAGVPGRFSHTLLALTVSQKEPSLCANAERAFSDNSVRCNQQWHGRW